MARKVLIIRSRNPATYSILEATVITSGKGSWRTICAQMLETWLVEFFVLQNDLKDGLVSKLKVITFRNEQLSELCGCSKHPIILRGGNKEQQQLNDWSLTKQAISLYKINKPFRISGRETLSSTNACPSNRRAKSLKLPKHITRTWQNSVTGSPDSFWSERFSYMVEHKLWPLSTNNFSANWCKRKLIALQVVLCSCYPCFHPKSFI